MNRDPFYGQIIERLKGTLDNAIFEDCAADLLRTIYPGLAPMRGGSDSGMDGAIADGLGEPFPLVTTTEEDVIGNFTGSLNSYLQHGGTRRRVVSATSRPLTPLRKHNLYDRARELGFELVNIHDQAAFADLLYHNPQWCLELLNLPSNPPPLSKIPRTERPFLNAPLIGRELSLNWLRQINGDRLLLGQPGAGKTFLLYQLAQDNMGLFLVSAERGDIAAGIRAQQPTAIFVDDAAHDLDLLLTLRHMREEMGVDFAIIAAGWPGDQIALTQALNLPDMRIHQLEPLTRDEIVQVIYGAGVRGPNQLVREIVDQAEGRPGLATTLALLCLQGGVHNVVFGDILSDSILNFADRFVGQQAAYILAVLAVAGDSGFSLTTVAQLLALPLIEVHRILNQLTATGVVMEVSERRLTVRPPVLRYALVRNVFFRGAALPIEPILACVPDRAEAALTLIGARGRGAAIPAGLLRSLAIETRSAPVWEAYAWLGRGEAEWILAEYPDLLATIVNPGLVHAPETFLPSLLTAAVGDRRPLHASPDHFLRRIGDWVATARHGTGEVFRRRRLLLDGVERWLTDNGDWAVSGQALQIALSPRFEYHITDPGQGRQVSFRYGTVSPDDLRQIQTLWPRVLSLMARVEITDWTLIHGMVEDWAYPRRLNPNLSEESSTLMRAFAVQMLRDIVLLVEQRPGTLHWAWHTARHLGADLAIPLNIEFEILYPPRTHEGNWHEAEERERAAVLDLAERWSHADPADIARNLARIETEANLADICWPRWTQALCTDLATRVASRVPWVRALMTANLPADLVFPFLQRAREANEEDWQSVASACFDQPALCGAAVALVLTALHPAEHLLTRALAQVDAYTEYVRWACVRNEIPEAQLRLLLRHPNSAIAGAAAEGEWLAEPRGVIRVSLRDDWAQAVLHSAVDHYWLGEILHHDPDLAYRWLQNNLADEDADTFSLMYERVIQSAVSVLTPDARRDLLDQIPDQYGFDALVAGLVSGYPDLYRHLLNTERLRNYHLTPLAGTPEGEWFEKAVLAHDAGFRPDEIAHATVHGHFGMITWSGSESAMWSEWVERFERLCTHSDERIQQIGEVGRAWASNQRGEAQRRERREAVYGMGL